MTYLHLIHLDTLLQILIATMAVLFAATVLKSNSIVLQVRVRTDYFTFLLNLKFCTIVLQYLLLAV